MEALAAEETMAIKNLVTTNPVRAPTDIAHKVPAHTDTTAVPATAKTAKDDKVKTPTANKIKRAAPNVTKKSSMPHILNSARKIMAIPFGTRRR